MGGGVPVFVNFIWNLGAIVFEVKMDATFAPHVAFLKSGSVVRILSTHGSPDDLTIVSYEDL